MANPLSVFVTIGASIAPLKKQLSKASGMLKMFGKNMADEMGGTGKTMADRISSGLSKTFQNMGTMMGGPTGLAFSTLGSSASKTFVQAFSGGVSVALPAALAAVMALAVAATVALSMRKLVNMISEGIPIASDYNETLNKTRVLLGSTAKAAEKTADELEKMGAATKTESLNAITSVATRLRKQGMSEQQSMEYAQQVVRRAVDVGSQSNMSTGEVLDKVESAMAGQFETMRSMNVDVGAESGKQIYGKDTGYGEIAVRAFLDQTGGAVNDFTNTMLSNANLAKRVEVANQAMLRDLGQRFLIVSQAWNYMKLHVIDGLASTFEWLKGMLATSGEDFAYAAVVLGKYVRPLLSGLMTLATGLLYVFGRVVRAFAWVADKIAKIWNRQNTSNAIGQMQAQNQPAEGSGAMAGGDVAKQLADAKAAATKPPGGEMEQGARSARVGLSSLLSDAVGDKQDRANELLQQLVRNTTPQGQGAKKFTGPTTLSKAVDIAASFSEIPAFSFGGGS